MGTISRKTILRQDCARANGELVAGRETERHLRIIDNIIGPNDSRDLAVPLFQRVINEDEHNRVLSDSSPAK
jgi:hypothetical protein